MRLLRICSRSPLRLTVRPLTALIFVGIMLGATRTARASDFYAIVVNLTGAKHPEAHLDVSGDSVTTRPGTEIMFNVFDVNGIQLSEFTVLANSGSFASTASAAPPNNDLFGISLGQPVLVKARKPEGSNNEYASLRQTLGTSTIVVGIPPEYGQSGLPIAVERYFP
jgi:hypothetical protein